MRSARRGTASSGKLNCAPRRRCGLTTCRCFPTSKRIRARKNKIGNHRTGVAVKLNSPPILRSAMARIERPMESDELPRARCREAGTLDSMVGLADDISCGTSSHPAIPDASPLTFPTPAHPRMTIRDFRPPRNHARDKHILLNGHPSICGFTHFGGDFPLTGLSGDGCRVVGKYLPGVQGLWAERNAFSFVVPAGSRVCGRR